MTPPGDVILVPTTGDLGAVARELELAVGWVGFLDEGDVLLPDAAARLVTHVADAPDVDLVYSDETSFYKPAWSPDRLRCQPYTGRLALLRADAVRAVGGLRPELGACAEHDLVVRVGERARSVVHVPEALCDRSASAGAYPTFPPGSVDLAVRVVDEHLARVGVQAVAAPHTTARGLLRLEPRLRSRPLVSVVIPTAGTTRRLRGAEVVLVLNCVESVLHRSSYTELEIVCVVDESTDDATCRALLALDIDRVRLVTHDGPFHFSRKVNRGVAAARGDILLVLNDDTEVEAPGWIEAMLVYALDPAVGAVGARLHFEDGRIQHMGVVGVGGNPGHPYYGLPGDTVGHGANALVPGNFLAVTGACLMTRRDAFEAVGGMSSWFPGSYNDLDYCLKLHDAGLRVVATPDAVLAHYESSSRDGTVAATELDLIRRRWGRLLRDDPFYGPNFPSGIADFVPGLNTP